MAQDYVDLEELVRNWAFDIFNKTTGGREKVELASSDIDWKDARIIHEPAVYTNQITNASPQTQVLYTANFINETEQPQMFKLKSERRTTSVSTISMSRALTKGWHVDLKLQPPNPIVEANAGFKGEMSIENSNEETFEEQMIWSVNNDIQVPPKTKITAELALTEVEFASEFICKTKLEGMVDVIVRSTKSSQTWEYSGHAHTIFLPEYGFAGTDDGVYFESKGDCKCRYGLEQHVRLHQTPL